MPPKRNWNGAEKSWKMITMQVKLKSLKLKYHRLSTSMIGCERTGVQTILKDKEKILTASNAETETYCKPIVAKIAKFLT